MLKFSAPEELEAERLRVHSVGVWRLLRGLALILTGVAAGGVALVVGSLPFWSYWFIVLGVMLPLVFGGALATARGMIVARNSWYCLRFSRCHARKSTVRNGIAI